MQKGIKSTNPDFTGKTKTVLTLYFQTWVFQFSNSNCSNSIMAIKMMADVSLLAVNGVYPFRFVLKSEFVNFE